MKKVLALILALIFAMNFAVVSFAGVAVEAAEDESIVAVVEDAADETVDENDDQMSSLLDNNFVRFILDLIEILKSTVAFLDKISNK